MVVREVAGQDAAQVPLMQDPDVVETFAPDGTDEAFREGVRVGRRLQAYKT